METVSRKASSVAAGLDGPAKIDPLTIYAIISVIVAVVRLVIACRQIWKVRHPGPFARARLRRVVNHFCKGMSSEERQEVFLAVLAVGRDTTDEEVREMYVEIVRAEYPHEEVPE